MKSQLKVAVTTAIALTQKQLERIKSHVAKKHQEFEVLEIVDPSVIGGMKITIDSQEIDETVYSKLEKLHNQLKQSAIEK